jgi:hypothetical protein
VDVTSKTGQVVTGILSHDDLERSVGDAIAFFALQVLFASNQQLPPGVYFPEEMSDKSIKSSIMEQISRDALLYTKDYKGI